MSTTMSATSRKRWTAKAQRADWSVPAAALTDKVLETYRALTRETRLARKAFGPHYPVLSPSERLAAALVLAA
jgi:hypothetical protein